MNFSYSKTCRLFLLMVLFAFAACKKEKPNPAVWKGSGVVTYTDYEPFADKGMRLFYYVPTTARPNTPIVFVLHGAERNALDYRNAIINKAEEKGFIAVVPEFSEANFPDVNGYQLGQVYADGDAPSAATLLPEAQWALSVIEPMFSFVKVKTNNSNGSYHMIGHSGGAQFVHRFLWFKQQTRLDKLVVSAAGWYTCPDANVPFPYGFQSSLLASVNLAPALAKQVYVQVGTSDNSTTTTAIRRDSLANLQGASRLARAQFFYQKAQGRAAELGVPFGWQQRLVNGLGHDYQDALPHAVDLLFP